MTGVTSAIILTKNSSQTLENAIDSLAFCDEIIVVDDGSFDSTVSLARKKGAIVYEHASHDDFALQRNWAMTKAKGDWIFFVDSDEVVSQDLAIEIANATRKGSARGYRLKRNDYVFGRWLRHGESSRVELLRLARAGAGSWSRPVHETWEIQKAVENLSHPLLHFPHQNVAQFIEKINSYTTINARFLYKSGEKAGFFQILGYPVGKFFVNYIYYQGFLDGTAGAVHAVLMSLHSFLTRAKLYLLWQSK